MPQLRYLLLAATLLAFAGCASAPRPADRNMASGFARTSEEDMQAAEQRVTDRFHEPDSKYRWEAVQSVQLGTCDPAWKDKARGMPAFYPVGAPMMPIRSIVVTFSDPVALRDFAWATEALGSTSESWSAAQSQNIHIPICGQLAAPGNARE